MKHAEKEGVLELSQKNLMEIIFNNKLSKIMELCFMFNDDRLGQKCRKLHDEYRMREKLIGTEKER